MVNFVVVTPLASVVELTIVKGRYVPFRAGCPAAPPTVTRSPFASVHAGAVVVGLQSPGLTSPEGVWMVTVVVVTEFTVETTIETNWVSDAFCRLAPKVLQMDRDAPKSWPKSM